MSAAVESRGGLPIPARRSGASSGFYDGLVTQAGIKTHKRRPAGRLTYELAVAVMVGVATIFTSKPQRDRHWSIPPTFKVLDPRKTEAGQGDPPTGQWRCYPPIRDVLRRCSIFSTTRMPRLGTRSPHAASTGDERKDSPAEVLSGNQMIGWGAV